MMAKLRMDSSWSIGKLSGKGAFCTGTCAARVIKGPLEDRVTFWTPIHPVRLQVRKFGIYGYSGVLAPCRTGASTLEIAILSLREPHAPFYHTRVGFCKELTTWPVPRSRPYFRKDDWQRSQAESQMPHKHLNLYRCVGTDGSSEAEKLFS